MTLNSEAYIIAPGGLGTVDELFEILCLMQTGMIDKVPVIVFDLGGFGGVIDSTLLWMVEMGTISEKDLDLIHITSNQYKIMKILKEGLK